MDINPNVRGLNASFPDDFPLYSFIFPLYHHFSWLNPNVSWLYKSIFVEAIAI